MVKCYSKYYSIINKSFLDEKQIILIDSEDDSYFGLSPIIDEEYICNLLNNNILENKTKLFQFVRNNLKYFTIPLTNKFFKNNSYEDTIISLFARSIICSSFNFSLTDSTISENEFEKIPNDIKNKYRFNFQKDEKKYKIIGYIDKILKEFLCHQFGIIFNKNYVHSNNIGNYAYYSGVIPRLVSVNKEINDRVYGSSIWKFNVTKTSYFTISSFENTQFNFHHLLENHLNFLVYFDDYNFNLIKEFNNTKYCVSENNIEKQLLDLNHYLNNSLHTNNIGITGNMVTLDNKLILTKRNSSSIDANQIYPSVNGNAEILDENVNFYKKSNYEDLPTIDLKSKFSKSFDKELTRETIAELNTINFSKKWKFIGFSALASYESTNKFQFNLIATTNSYSNYSEIYKLQSLASESYENSSLYGMELIIYKNIIDLIAKYFNKYIFTIKNSILTLLSIFSISMLIYSIITGKIMVVNDIISIVSFATLSLFSIYLVCFSYIKNRLINKTKFKLYIKSDSNLRDINLKIKCHKFFKNRKLNLVTENAISNHVHNIVINNNKFYWNF